MAPSPLKTCSHLKAEGDAVADLPTCSCRVPYLGMLILRLRVCSTWDQLLALHCPDFAVLAHNIPGGRFSSFSLKREITEPIGLCDKADPIICPGTARHHFSHHRKMLTAIRREGGGKEKKKRCSNSRPLSHDNGSVNTC